MFPELVVPIESLTTEQICSLRLVSIEEISRKYKEIKNICLFYARTLFLASALASSEINLGSRTTCPFVIVCSVLLPYFSLSILIITFVIRAI